MDTHTYIIVMFIYVSKNPTTPTPKNTQNEFLVFISTQTLFLAVVSESG